MKKLENFIGNLLRLGVIVSAVVTLIGGELYLWRSFNRYPDYSVFRGASPETSNIIEIIKAAFTLNSKAIIQVGILILLVTPILRVLFSLFAFLKERDYTYVGVTVVVLLVLVYGVIGVKIF
jgi:uncharacterized membrane protein